MIQAEGKLDRAAIGTGVLNIDPLSRTAPPAVKRFLDGRDSCGLALSAQREAYKLVKQGRPMEPC